MVDDLAEDMGLEPTGLLHLTRFPGELLSHSVNPPCLLPVSSGALANLLRTIAWKAPINLPYKKNLGKCWRFFFRRFLLLGFGLQEQELRAQLSLRDHNFCSCAWMSE